MGPQETSEGVHCQYSWLQLITINRNFSKIWLQLVLMDTTIIVGRKTSFAVSLQQSNDEVAWLSMTRSQTTFETRTQPTVLLLLSRVKTDSRYRAPLNSTRGRRPNDEISAPSTSAISIPPSHNPPPSSIQPFFNYTNVPFPPPLECTWQVLGLLA